MYFKNLAQEALKESTEAVISSVKNVFYSIFNCMYAGQDELTIYWWPSYKETAEVLKSDLTEMGYKVEFVQDDEGDNAVKISNVLAVGKPNFQKAWTDGAAVEPNNDVTKIDFAPHE
jgi:hypothetical protein